MKRIKEITTFLKQISKQATKKSKKRHEQVEGDKEKKSSAQEVSGREK